MEDMALTSQGACVVTLNTKRIPLRGTLRSWSEAPSLEQCPPRHLMGEVRVPRMKQSLRRPPPPGDLKQTPDLVCSANHWALLSVPTGSWNASLEEGDMGLPLPHSPPALNILLFSSNQLEVHLG